MITIKIQYNCNSYSVTFDKEVIYVSEFRSKIENLLRNIMTKESIDKIFNKDVIAQLQEDQKRDITFRLV